MEKKKKDTLLLNLFRSDCYRAYDEMIERLSPLLQTPPQHPRLIERLDFRQDLPRGYRKMIYLEIARLLQSGYSVLAPGCSKNDLFRWLANPRHTNLGINFQSIKARVNEMVTLYV
ncbi:MAG: hypothetical protein J5953_11970 [Prevotella sp.]|nr:hypothetical protein [Prevotella sp.]